MSTTREYPRSTTADSFTQAVNAPDCVSHLNMQAIVQYSYGSADVLVHRTISRPEVAADEVLMEVRTAGVDQGVWHLMTGLPYLVRLAGFGVVRPKNPVLGLDVAGVVVAIGDAVTRFQPGDEVFGIAKGSYAEYTTADQHKLAIKPHNLSFEQAAVAAISGITALEALTDVGQLQVGQSVLVIGASGGVGTYAVQLARQIGARVTAVGGPDMADVVCSIGADRYIDYTREDFVDGESQYDLILDIGGRNSISRLRSVLKPTGTLVIVGGEGGDCVTGGVGRQLRAMMISPFISQTLTSFISTESSPMIERLASYLRSGAVVPIIGQRYCLDEVPAAMRHLKLKTSSGKSVVVIRGG